MIGLNPLLLEQLETGAQALNIHLNEEQIVQLDSYIHLLIKWGRSFNLTAIKEPEKIISHHILDSLSIVPYLWGKEIIDVGSGAGLPGIPCAIALPEKQFTLLDSIGKKTRFMTQVVAEIKLQNVKVVQSRVEAFHPEKKFDVITARAFSKVDKLWCLTQHLLAPGGELVLMKGLNPQAELEKFSNRAKVYKLSVPGVLEQRHLVIIKGFDE
jgi:16S rRNA (guanine527-N7)-methyltransferase